MIVPPNPTTVPVCASENDIRPKLGEVFAAIEIPSLAISYYERAFGDSVSTSRDHQRLASAYLASYEFDAASRAIAEGMKIGPGSPTRN